jgi:hypothetical protein
LIFLQVCVFDCIVNIVFLFYVAVILKFCYCSFSLTLNVAINMSTLNEKSVTVLFICI